MYVAELDRPWTDTPFMFQGFHLRTDQQLEVLKKFCKHVFVDMEKTEVEARSRPRAPAPRFKIRGSTAYPEAVNVETEVKRAAPVYTQTVAAVNELLRPLTQGGTVLEAKEVKESVRRLTDSVVRNPDALLLVSKLRAKSEAAHARALQVSIYMIVFARFLELAREELELLGLLGLLQDERQDGSGYPRGLKGEHIGLYGSIAAIADTFDALTAVRPYAETLSPSSALSFLYKERGTGYHSELVEQFIQCVGAFPVGSVVELNSAEVGIVIAQNLVRRLKPRVMVVLDGQGNPMRPHKILDLDKDPKVRPDEPYRIRRTMEQSKLEVDPRELFL